MDDQVQWHSSLISNLRGREPAKSVCYRQHAFTFKAVERLRDMLAFALGSVREPRDRVWMKARVSQRCLLTGREM